MTKQEFIAQVANQAGSSKAETERVVNAALETISGALQKGESVQFVGFGTFEVRERAARTGLNPQTKQQIQIPAKKVPAFKVGAALKKSVS